MRLHNPDKLNALTFQTYEELERLFADLAHDDQVKVIIITGSGKGFCSGGSVHEIIGKLIDMSADELHRFTRMTCNVTKHMRNLRKPIIAAVNGIAAGAGTMLALASDIRLVSDRAKFAFLFVKVGLSGADMGACYLLPRLVGLGKATELLFLGDTIDAQEAYRIGLANRVVEHEKLLHEAHELALRLKQGPLQATGSHQGPFGAGSEHGLRKRVDPGGGGASRLHGKRGFQRRLQRLCREARAGTSTAHSY